MAKRSAEKRIQVVGLDLGDRWSQLCVLDGATGEVIEESRVRTTPEALRERFGDAPRMRIALEVGPHSPWVSRLLQELGHEVIVANAGKVRLIFGNSRKRDRVDARSLARLARLDPELLHPIRHRSAQTQYDLAVVRSRQALVKARTQLINHVRSMVKAVGGRLPACSAESFPKKVAGALPEPLRATLVAIVEMVATLTAQIRRYDQQVEELCQSRYPATGVLRQVTGVGALTALSYQLVLEDPSRFRKSRMVGPYLGLVPKLDRSGERDPQLRITKEGDELLRRLLVSSAQYILGPFGPPCDLRRYGERIAGRGGKLGKKKAVVAVARKLGVLLHHLWVTGEVYDPFYSRPEGSTPEVQVA